MWECEVRGEESVWREGRGEKTLGCICERVCVGMSGEKDVCVSVEGGEGKEEKRGEGGVCMGEGERAGRAEWEG